MHDTIVRIVRVFFRIMDALARVRVDVRASDELDGERPAFLLGERELGLQFRAGVFEVGLQGVVDESGTVGVGVVCAHEGDGPAVDGGLHGVLLGVDPDAAALGLGFLADLVHCFDESGRGFFVVD